MDIETSYAYTAQHCWIDITLNIENISPPLHIPYAQGWSPWGQVRGYFFKTHRLARPRPILFLIKHLCWRGITDSLIGTVSERPTAGEIVSSLREPRLQRTARHHCRVVKICFSRVWAQEVTLCPPSCKPARYNFTKASLFPASYSIRQKDGDRQTDSESCVCKMIAWYSVRGDGQMGHPSSPWHCRSQKRGNVGLDWITISWNTSSLPCCQDLLRAWM